MTKKIIIEREPVKWNFGLVTLEPFDVAKKRLEQAGYHIPSLEENAELRIQEGENSSVCNLGNYVSDGVLYVPQRGIFWTPNSPIMRNPEQATQCHRDGSEFYLTPEQVEAGLVGAVKINSEPIPTNRFGENEFTAKCFGKNAQAYGKFLRNSKYKIKEMPIWLVYISNKPFARQLWFSKLDDGSELFDANRSLGDGYGFRGVKRIS